ncbi:MAG TPA: alpha/beta fold hydrolase, partial [Jatrophihabitans sp.]|nr:alpha/beta fold hydrolase [Jatrophihabitans sp.]
RTMGPKALRHSTLGYGGLVAKPLDPDLTARWVRPAATDKAIARNGARFMAGIDKRDLIHVGSRLGRFDKPVLLVWGTADRFFKLSMAQRLHDAFTDARLVRIEGARTFVPLDEPYRVAEEITAFTTLPA